MIKFKASFWTSKKFCFGVCLLLMWIWENLYLPKLTQVRLHRVSQWFPNFFLRATQIWVWWTPRDQSLKQCMKKMIACMIFGSNLLRSFSMLAIYYFLKFLRSRQTQTSSGTLELFNPVVFTTQLWKLPDKMCMMQ